MLWTALELAACGLHVFPCRPRDKRPATADGLKSATIDADTIEQWWRSGPESQRRGCHRYALGHFCC